SYKFRLGALRVLQVPVFGAWRTPFILRSSIPLIFVSLIMNCLPCLGKKKSEKNKPDGKEGDEELPVAQPKEDPLSNKSSAVKNSASNTQDESSDDDSSEDDSVDEPPTSSASCRFTYNDLASATENFDSEYLLGESENGKVYRGTLEDGKVVAVKKLKKRSTKAKKEFIEEVKKLCDIHHPNLVELVGYCADHANRLLVYEYMPMGSINDHLHDLPPGKKPLDWITRMKVATGVAHALEHLHEKLNPPVLCGNIRSTNILLDRNFEPKVTDYGLVNLESSSGSKVHKRVVGTAGCAPESVYTGELTVKSHVYSFGVILLELITGRKGFDTSRPTNERNLVSWAKPYIKDPKRFQELGDPRFKGAVSENNIYQAVELVALCLQDEWSARPLISHIIGALTLLTQAQHKDYTAHQKHPSSSSSSSSDSDSDRELDIKIEQFNWLEPEAWPKREHESESDSDHEVEPDPESEHEPELEEEPEWESETDTDTETEPELEPEPEPELDPEFELDSTYSISDSDSEPEPVSKLEPILVPDFKPEPLLEQKSNPEPALQPESKHEPTLEPDSKPELVLEPESNLDPVIELESKPEPMLKPESEPEQMLELESNPEPVHEPESNPEPVHEPESNPKPVLEPKSNPEPVIEPESKPEPALEPESKPEPALEPESKPIPVNEPESKPEPVLEPESKAEPVLDPDSKPEPVLKPESKPEPMLEPESKPELVLEPESKLELVLEPESKPEPVHELDSKPDPMPDPESKTEPAHEPESKPDRVPEPESKIEPVLEPESKREPVLESESKTESVLEPESKREAVLEPKPNQEPVVKPESKPKPLLEPKTSFNQKDESSSDHDSDGSSGTAYAEDAFSEEDFSDEDKASPSTLLNSKSKARLQAKSSKKKVGFKIGETKSIKPDTKRVNSSNKSKVDNDQRSKSKSIRKSDSRGYHIEYADESDDDFEPKRFKSTISRFGADSRSYEDDESDDGSSTEGAK
ncbi:hypothetical protein M8C21_023005, partial [Ambrosia artemisiifolia]